DFPPGRGEVLKMNVKVKLFIILFAGGFAGVLSLVLLDLNALIAILPLPPGTEMPMSISALKLLSLVQPTVILAVAVLIGVGLSSKVGLSSPVAEAAASRSNWASALKTQIVPGVIGGLAGGLTVVSIAAILTPFLSHEVLTRLGEFGNVAPLPLRLLYGGITEELLLRWGLMTLLVWAGWHLFQKGKGRPRSVCFVAAILISSFIFAIGHLPVAFMLFPEPTPALVLFVIFGNSAFGLVAGWLYWKKGLESAIIAHALTHVVMFSASYFGAYF
ncbi:MAG: CPBP family intramembrane glutamic endopeptidase, partial [Pyrinomonadaceae bacterium]